MKTFNVSKDTTNQECIDILREWFTYTNMKAYQDDEIVSFSGQAWRLWNIDIIEARQGIPDVLINLIKNFPNDMETLKRLTYIVIMKNNKDLEKLFGILENKAYSEKYKTLIGDFINTPLPTK